MVADPLKDYAEAMSQGETARAACTLADIAAPSGAAPADAADPVAVQLAAWIVAQGWHVDRDVGRSHLRCDLALRRTDARRSRGRERSRVTAVRPLVKVFDASPEVILGRTHASSALERQPTAPT